MYEVCGKITYVKIGRTNYNQMIENKIQSENMYSKLQNLYMISSTLSTFQEMKTTS